MQIKKFLSLEKLEQGKAVYNHQKQCRLWRKSALALAVSLVCSLHQSHAEGHSEMTEKSGKTGILLVTFGTSNATARQAFDNIEKLAEKRFEGMEVRWAYTSSIIRNILRKQGKEMDSPVTALAKMRDDGFTDVAVQSLHVIAGAEYDELQDTVQTFRRQPFGFDSITLGKPLLASYDDVRVVCNAVLEYVPEERQEEDAVIFMGHGTHHPAGLSYVAVDSVLSDLDSKAFFGNIEGHPTLERVVKQCKEAEVKKAWLMPFMSVAGDHARNDMAGDSDDSWVSVLEKNRVECQPVIKGMGEYNNVVQVWLDHLDNAVSRLSEGEE